MLGDCGILGLPEGSSREEVKEAFRRRVKEAHPDLQDGADETELLRRHLLFIAINQAYRRLMASAGEAPSVPQRTAAAPERPATTPPSSPRPPAGTPRAGAGKNALISHGDPAYAFYRQGMKAFMAIHPSAWNSEPGLLMRLETPIAGHEEEQREAQEKAREVARLFPSAYYYFSIVCAEYPSSLWAADARDKMALIEGRITLYRKIVESFRPYRRAPPRVDESLKRTMPRKWSPDGESAP